MNPAEPMLLDPTVDICPRSIAIVSARTAAETNVITLVPSYVPRRKHKLRAKGR